MDKVAMLNEILSQAPKDAFARYGLAMEYANRGELATAMHNFDLLLKDNPDYTPGYLMAAQTLVRSKDTAAAIERLRSGIECARRTSNHHALNEMQGLLEELEMGSS